MLPLQQHPTGSYFTPGQTSEALAIQAGIGARTGLVNGAAISRVWT